MDILIRLAEIGNNKKTFVFPSNPESISGTIGAKYQSFDIISKGTIKVPKGMNITEIKWDGEFFGQAKKNESVVLKSYYQEPNQCMAQLLARTVRGRPARSVHRTYQPYPCGRFPSTFLPAPFSRRR